MASNEGAEGSVVPGGGNGNATLTFEAATPTSQLTSSRAGGKRKRTSAVWYEMEEKIENGQLKAECNYCQKNLLQDQELAQITCICIWNLVLLGMLP